MHKNYRKWIYLNIHNWVHTFLLFGLDYASINMDPTHNTWHYPFENESNHQAASWLLNGSQYQHTKGLKLLKKIIAHLESCYTKWPGWLTTTFSLPFISLMIKPNFYKSSIDLISLSLASFLVRKYLRATW